ncbi:nascent polypeptide-associated complex subunit alpha, muscle-specific form-like isoform X3 [Penaeus japonicus]|uniref:nascent polypeptide-associated complex subunit alpha, muscle-specific form-like isoform X3 n=1 Tax=Penaeus japonicus TaxID=27405 RepID=UPI001C71501E|nr:nascent polypeptide-associated complex subunit alpha, muscle-specific form-like isoform X3 [Penaeus japonicus]
MEAQNTGMPGAAPPSSSQTPGYPGAPPPYTQYFAQQCPGGSSPGGAAPYGLGFCVPPPVSHQQPYPLGHSEPPPPYPGGTSLYPDISQCPQPQAVVYGFGPASPTAPPNQPAHPSLTPTRPAPSPPAHHHSPARPPPPAPTEYTTVGNFPKDPSLNGRARSPPLREGEAPPSCVVSWRGAAGLKLYFIQPEGHIVSPLKPLSLTVFKKIGGTPTTGDNSLIGCLEIPGVWRLKLRAKRCFCLHTYPDSYVFLDDSTNPQRVVVLQLPEDVSTTMLADLLALLREMTDLREEQEGVVDKITTGVSTVYTDLTKKINTAVKDTVPGAHKSTKWLRKGTGSLVRLGGNLVSKGMHLIADQVSPGNPQEESYEESAVHSSLVDTLITFRKKLETNEVTYV